METAMERPVLRFATWRDNVVSPLVEVAILSLSFGGLRLAEAFFPQVRAYSGLGKALLFYLAVLILTLIALKILRVLYPFEAGTFSYREDSFRCYIWNLYGFLFTTNLFFLRIPGLVPVPLRKPFYQLLGATMGRGIISISGQLEDPYFTTIEENAIIGHDALLLGHLIIPDGDDDRLILGHVTVRRGALIGARSILLPGVTVGAGSVVNAMSLVPMNTDIPPGEVWGGIPAVKRRDLVRSTQPENVT
jgi:hypothetical protein